MVEFTDPSGLSPKAMLYGLTKAGQGALQGAAGAAGAAACTVATIVLVADDATVIGVIDDAAAVVTGIGAVASGTYGLMGMKKLVEGAIEFGQGLTDTISDLFTMMKAKDRKEKERDQALEEKHGDSTWVEPASEDYAQWKAREKEKRDGKEGRRDSHDEKGPGDPDRSQEQIDEDYE